jgi:hypothetical protein
MAELHLACGQVVLVDDEDLPKVTGFNWRTDKRGAVIATIPKAKSPPRIVVLNRLILGIAHGDTDELVGFSNENRLDFRKENLKVRRKKWHHELPDIACACGCGNSLRPYDANGMPRTFLQGHYLKWKTEEERATAKRQWGRSKVAKAKNRYRNFKRLALLFFGNVCYACGLAYDGKNAAAFEFDHIHPETKSANLSKQLLCGCDIEAIVSELLKCRLFYANCHNQHHAGPW